MTRFWAAWAGVGACLLVTACQEAEPDHEPCIQAPTDPGIAPSQLPPVSAIAAGAQHTCVLVDGGVRCWGHNRDGQMGNGTQDWQYGVATPPHLESGFVLLSAGEYHSCAYSDELWCWGANGDGALGNASAVPVASPPVVVEGLHVQKVACGGYHTCAILDDQTLSCWGFGRYGQLGTGNLDDSPVPVNVPVPWPVTHLATGFDHNCVVAGEKVWCWGLNEDGQVGDGSQTQRDTPVEITGFSSPVVELAARSTHTCAILADGGISCWGLNEHGQLGDGTKVSRLVPTPVKSLPKEAKPIAIGVGSWHTCALFDDRKVRCWGGNDQGQLSSNYPDVTAPGVAQGVVGAIALSVGSTHSCVLQEGGHFLCWGSDYFGQISGSPWGGATMPYCP